MSEADDLEDRDKYVMQDRTAALEQRFRLEYLQGKGHTFESVRALPAEEAKRLLRDASIYASNKLAEVEKRARFVLDLHDSSQ